MDDPFKVEIIVSSTIFAAAISALYGHYLLDQKGRKATLVIALVIFVVGSIIMALAGLVHGSTLSSTSAYATLVFGRIVIGIAIGLASDAGPLYISECAPPSLRGSFTTLFNVAVVSGQVAASIVCGCLSYLPPSYNWRLMLGLGAIPAIVQMVGFLTLPLSPTWLCLQGRHQEAEQVLRRIRPQSNHHIMHMPVSKQEEQDEDGNVTESSSNNSGENIDGNEDSQRQQQQQQHEQPHEDPVIHELNEIQEEVDAAKQGTYGFGVQPNKCAPYISFPIILVLLADDVCCCRLHLHSFLLLYALGHHVGLWTLWTKFPHVRRAMILGCSLWAISQVSSYLYRFFIRDYNCLKYSEDDHVV
jgi:MFS family permease